MNSEYDVIVVGAGNAALCAAIAAAEQARRVLVLEKASHEERGGNTRFSGGTFRTAHNGKADVEYLIGDVTRYRDWDLLEIEPYSEEDLYNEIMYVTKNKANPNLTRVFANKSRDTIRWMHDKAGVDFELMTIFNFREQGYHKIRGGRVIQAKDRGVGLSSFLFKKAESLTNIEIAYNAEGRKLLTKESAVCGVGVSANGSQQDINSHAVILGSGGFEANRDWRGKYMGESWRMTKVRGTRHNTGLMTEAALQVGAQKYGDWSDCHSTPIDARAPEYGDLALTDKTNRLSYPLGIMINKRGKRFLDEGEDFADLTYAKTGKILMQQPEAFGVQIFNQDVLHLLEKRYETTPAVHCNSLAELASRYEIASKELEGEVGTFNNSIHNVAVFNPYEKDGRSTKLVNPPKSNWANQVDTTNFTVYPVTGGITFTFGGIRINERAEVLDSDNQPIQCLYATGEITGGFFYHNYAAGTGLVRGSVFGKIAGSEAAQLAS